MICVSIAEPTFDACLQALQGERIAEIRLDYLDVGNEEIETLFSQQLWLIATCRPVHFSEDQRIEKLTTAMASGAKYIDIEYEAPKEYRETLIKNARLYNTEVIISYHNYDETPDEDELKAIIKESFEMGADIVKLATMVNSHKDNARIISLYNTEERVIAFGMGEAGKFSRVAASVLGAEFNYAAKTSDRTVAPGQMGKMEMQKILDDLNEL